jgi:hypothetical protein
LTHKNLVYGFGGGSVDFTENTLREELERDLNKRLLVVAGIEDYRNTMIFIDKRLTSYGGLGAEVFKNERQQVNLVGGLGFVNFGFDEAAMLRVNPAETATLPGFAPSTGGGMGGDHLDSKRELYEALPVFARAPLDTRLGRRHSLCQEVVNCDRVSDQRRRQHLYRRSPGKGAGPDIHYRHQDFDVARETE